MELNGKLMELAKKASSAEEAVKLGEENGYSVTLEEAEKYLSLLNGNGPMSDDELEAVAGGKHEEKTDPDPKYHAGQTLWIGYPTTRTFVKVTIRQIERYSENDGWRYLVWNERGYEESYYLDYQGYILTSDPQGEWPFKK